MAIVKTIEKDIGFAKILIELKKLDDNPFVKTGWPAEEPKVSAKHEGSPLTVAEIIIIHEFGAPDAGIPERSSVRSTYDANVKKWGQQTDKLVGQIYDGKLTVETALDRIGLVMINDTKKTIVAGIAPPLKTRVGTPLIDTAQTLNALTFKRFKKREK